MVALGAWLSAMLAVRVSGPYSRLAFGVFVIGLGVSMAVDAVRQLHWL
jgi:uncharacterized membrane protein YfcA